MSEVLQVVFGIILQITDLVIYKVIHGRCKCSVPTESPKSVFWNAHDWENT